MPVVIWTAQVVALPLPAAFAFGVFGVPTHQPGFLPIVGLMEHAELMLLMLARAY